MTTPHDGLVFDVQRFSVHDGPGIRTVVFFKGCTLACAWCQNPEAVHAAPELAYYADRCLEGCARCVEACPEGALASDRIDRVDGSKCTVCGRCVEVCPSAALRQIGRRVTPAALLEEVLRDAPFFRSSGGGLTLSGGEPVMQARFLAAFLPLARQAGLHVTLETAGHYPFALLEPLLPWLDLVLIDLKVMDPLLHQQMTGHDNVHIHDNLRALVARKVPVEVRMPVVPGYNTSADNITATAAFLHDLGLSKITLLPYNPLWEAKLPHLHTTRGPLQIPAPTESFYVALQHAFASEDVQVSRGPVG